MSIATGPQRELHVRRVRESLGQIPDWRKNPLSSQTQGFKAWRDRTRHSLGEVFGDTHDYVKRFSNLHFRVPRVVFFAGMPSWTHDDEQACREDLFKAEQLLKDALEEVESVPELDPRAGRKQDGKPDAPTVLVQVHNILSQSMSVDIDQLIASIGTMALDAEVKHEAETQVRAIEAEARGQQRWSVMAKPLDLLKGLGRGVYEKVALPLLLEIIKRQTALGGP